MQMDTELKTKKELKSLFSPVFKSVSICVICG